MRGETGLGWVGGLDVCQHGGGWTGRAVPLQSGSFKTPAGIRLMDRTQGNRRTGGQWNVVEGKGWGKRGLCGWCVRNCGDIKRHP